MKHSIKVIKEVAAKWFRWSNTAEEKHFAGTGNATDQYYVNYVLADATANLHDRILKLEMEYGRPAAEDACDHGNATSMPISACTMGPDCEGTKAKQLAAKSLLETARIIIALMESEPITEALRKRGLTWSTD